MPNLIDICHEIEPNAKSFVNSHQMAHMYTGFSSDINPGHFIDIQFAEVFGSDFVSSVDPNDPRASNLEAVGKLYIMLSQPDANGNAYLVSTGMAHYDKEGRENKHLFAIHAEYNLLAQALEIIKHAPIEEAKEDIDTLLKFVTHWRNFDNYPAKTTVLQEVNRLKLSEAEQEFELNNPQNFRSLTENCDHIYTSMDMRQRTYQLDASGIINADFFVASMKPRPDENCRLPKIEILVQTLNDCFISHNETQILRAESNGPDSLRIVRNIEKRMNLPYEDGALVATIEYLPSPDTVPVVKLGFYKDGFVHKDKSNMFTMLKVYSLQFTFDDTKYYSAENLRFRYDHGLDSGNSDSAPAFLYSTLDEVAVPCNDNLFLEDHFPFFLRNYLIYNTRKTVEISHIRSALSNIRLKCESQPELAYVAKRSGYSA
ncbi:MAG: hypothetical protein KKF44_05915 [Nanoarchaeota archaeon]|nr:hypothetical protein [Nanoarchaeota archaeon]